MSTEDNVQKKKVPDGGDEAVQEHLPAVITTMKAEIDALQIEVGKEARPWWQRVPIIISVIALAFSFGTTLVSELRTERILNEARHTELRGHIRRFSELGRANMEAYGTYEQQVAFGISSALQTEATVIAGQALQLIDDLPPDEVNAREYLAVSEALSNAQLYTQALRLTNLAAAKAEDLATVAIAERYRGASYFALGAVDDGRAAFASSLRVYTDSLDQESAIIGTYTNAQTEIYWGGIEQGYGFVSEARLHLERAEAYINDLPRGPGSESLRAQLREWRSAFPPGL